MVEEEGVRILLYERANSSSVWYSFTRPDGSKVRKSLKTISGDTAIENAKALATEIDEARLTGRDARWFTLGQIFGEYSRLKAPNLLADRRKAGATRQALFKMAWGSDRVVLDVSQTDADRFMRLRRSGELVPNRGGRTMEGVRDGTIDGDFRWLSSVFDWARKHKEGGRRLLPENPLHDVEWPKEANPLRPVASHERYTATLAHVDDVDGEGILALLRYTRDRRLGAICALRADDVLLTADQIRATLAASGMDERLAAHMPHGAIRWSEQSDKMGLLFVSPLSEPARAALETCLRQSPRLGSVPLLPAPKCASVPIDSKLVGKWIRRAERRAGLPKLRGSTAHAYRRLWASERKNLPDVDVAAAGGWKDTRSLKTSDQQADPASVLNAVLHGSG